MNVICKLVNVVYKFNVVLCDVQKVEITILFLMALKNNYLVLKIKQENGKVLLQ